MLDLSQFSVDRVKMGLDEAIECLSTLKAMYPLEGELTYSESTIQALVDHAAGREGVSPSELAFTIHFPVERPETGPVSLGVDVTIGVEMTSQVDVKLARVDDVRRSTLTELSERFIEAKARLGTELLGDEGDGFDDRAAFVSAAVSELQEIATELLSSQDVALTTSNGANTPPAASLSTSCIRAWFRFPSLSTRSKRDDLVTFAPRYRLTGFVIAGKPGLLCLECPSDSPSSLDDYMSDIKRVSWSDIPPAHKKVSEVLREDNVERVFADMKEMTDEIGKRGERANRVEGAQVADWLRSCGVEDDVVRQVMMG